MTMPLVSVILPVYNVAPYVKAAIDSILLQDYAPFELIVINDGSKDDTLAIVQDYASDPRVHIISRENRGLVASLNEGLQAAQGELIARMDGDDLAYQGRFKAQVDCFLKDPDLALCGTHVDYLYANNQILSVPPQGLSAEQIKIATIFDVFFVHPTLMFSRRLVEDGMLYRKEYLHSEDFDLLRKVTQRYKTHIIPQPYLAFRINHVGSVRSMHAIAQAHMHHKIVEENLKFFGIIDAKDSLLTDCTSPDYDIRKIDRSAFRALLGKIAAGSKLFPANDAVYHTYYISFLNHLFKSLTRNADVAAVAALYKQVGVAGFLHPREKLLISLRTFLPSAQAIAVRDFAVRLGQRVRGGKKH